MTGFAKNGLLFLGTILIIAGNAVPRAAGAQNGSGQIDPYAEPRPDSQVTTEARRILEGDPFLANDDLTAEARNGVVYVTGTVENLAHERRVFEDGLVDGCSGIDLTGIKLMPATPEENQTRIWPPKKSFREMMEIASAGLNNREIAGFERGSMFTRAEKTKAPKK